MDKGSRFRHEGEGSEVAASCRSTRESRTISMLFSDFLSGSLGSAAAAPSRGKDHG
jgi:hypothetical protein